jgi:hypothetical protein
MAIQIAGTNGISVQADDYNDSLRVSAVPRGDGYSLAIVTAVLGPATAANSCHFAMRLNPGSTKNAYVTQFRVQWCTTTVFTTAVTAGRRLSLYRGSGAAAATGTAFTAMAKMNTGSAASQFDSASSGDVRMMATGATGLTVVGITFETQEIESFQLAGLGAAGASFSFERRYDGAGSSPIVLLPGQLLALRNPAAMDAAGVYQLGIDVEWYEL